MTYAERVNRRLKREITERGITLQNLYEMCEEQVSYSMLQQLYKTKSRTIDKLSSLEILCKALDLDLLEAMADKAGDEITLKNPRLNVEQFNEKWNCEEVIRYIDQFYNEALSLDELADHFFINKYHLAKTFKKKYGITVFQYIKQVRMDHAVHYLLETDYSVNQIAVLCGFSDISYFYRVFKETTGVTAKKYRNGKKEDENLLEKIRP